MDFELSFSYNQQVPGSRNPTPKNCLNYDFLASIATRFISWTVSLYIIWL